MKKPLHADSRRDNFDSLINFISDRRHSISRLRPHYIPVQAGYMAHRPAPAPELITVLMPPPPAQLPTSPVTQPPWDSTTMRTTETPPTPTEGTTFATPEATVSVHKVRMMVRQEFKCVFLLTHILVCYRDILYHIKC